jgi:predicted O-methyltransferase YrrM
MLAGVVGVAAFAAGVAVGHTVVPKGTADAAVIPAAKVSPEKNLVLTDPTVSLFHHPFMPIPDTPRAKAAERGLLRCLDGRRDGCEEARAVLTEASGEENFGGDYPTLLWLSEYLLADEPGQKAMAADPEGARFLWFWHHEDWRMLRELLEAKAEIRPRHRLSDGYSFLFLDEVLRFNGPGRETWEHTADIVAAIDPKPGMVLADIGAGSGYHSFRFAEQVGETGVVYAVEIDVEHLDYLRAVKEHEKIAPLRVVEGATTSVGLPADSVDVAFLSGTYQAVYGSVRTADRKAWIASLREVLRPGGRLVIVDNVPDGELAPGLVPYRGISVSKALVVAQLEASGFRLVAEPPSIPQRYILVFEEAA